MIYTRLMSARNIALFAAPIVAVSILVPWLNALEANPNVAFAALSLVAVVCGAALGAFANPVPELPWKRSNREATRSADSRKRRR